ncbi:MAG: hypothetical protein M0R46_00870 [Candidatus Muirbacterium halophilum]|nr:hypothetical protein [Candidatus Muirbacterium halophilum]MCK9474446.1 hypothetical protein [Candidatus Muirbacterium halophilum]
MIEFTEGELKINFNDSKIENFQKLDTQGKTIPQGMKFVDIVFNKNDVTYMIEIKNPSNSNSQANQITKYLTKLKNNEIINHELVPKARDSYTYLHLMKENKENLIYIVLLGIEKLFDENDRATFLLNFNDRLKSNIKKECDRPWERQYIKNILVFSIEDWNINFKNWKISRNIKEG